MRLRYSIQHGYGLALTSPRLAPVRLKLTTPPKRRCRMSGTASVALSKSPCGPVSRSGRATASWVGAGHCRRRFPGVLTWRGSGVDSHCVLRDRDILPGGTKIRFFDPSPERPCTVSAHAAVLARPAISAAQTKVLVALCAPYQRRSAFARPASNEAIAGQLVFSVDDAECRLRALFISRTRSPAARGEAHSPHRAGIVRGIVCDTAPQPRPGR